MYTVIFVLIVIGAALALVAAAIALRGYLRLRRTRAAVQAPLTAEVERLAARTDELEEGLSALDARAQQLPIQIHELQQSLATLQVLTGSLAVTLRQAQTILSFSALKVLSAERLGDLLRSRQVPRADPRSR